VGIGGSKKVDLRSPRRALICVPFKVDNPRNTNPSELRTMSRTNVTWVARMSGTIRPITPSPSGSSLSCWRRSISLYVPSYRDQQQTPKRATRSWLVARHLRRPDTRQIETLPVDVTNFSTSAGHPSQQRIKAGRLLSGEMATLGQIRLCSAVSACKGMIPLISEGERCIGY
jgi:hypothetical protein